MANEKMEKYLRRLIVKAISQSSKEFGFPDHVEEIKNYVRQNPDIGPAVAWSAIAKHFGESNLQKRKLSLELCDVLFLRSQRFRFCVIEGFDTFNNLLENCGDSKHESQFRSNVLRVCESWQHKFGGNSQRIFTVIEHFKSKVRKGMLQSSSDVSINSQEEIEARKVWKISQLKAQIEAEIGKILVSDENFQLCANKALMQMKTGVGKQTQHSEVSSGHINLSGSHLLQDLGVFTSNYELEIKVEKPKLVLCEEQLCSLFQALNIVKREHLPKLCAWELELGGLQMDDIRNYGLHPLCDQISLLKTRLSRTVQRIENITFEPSNGTSDEEMDDVPL